VKNSIRLTMIVMLLLPGISCRKVIDYFRDPDTGQLVETIHTTVMAGYAANLAFAVMDGQSFPHVGFSRSNAGYPCTTVMVADTRDDNGLLLADEKATTITIAGLWPDESTAILSIIFTDYHAGSSTIDLLGIETIPAIRDGNHICIALAGMEIKMNPDQESLLSVNLNTLEIESELFRLEAPRTVDVYVAVLQDAYFIDIYSNTTRDIISDDSYEITGGGQLIEVSGSAAEIKQQAMVEVLVSPACRVNPVGGMALVKVTGVEEDGFPELGTALLEFPEGCEGTVRVFAGTGMYIGATGRNVSFRL
jgi:hypothetical protein